MFVDNEIKEHNPRSFCSWFKCNEWNDIKSTLADEFLADLDELEAEEEQETQEQKTIDSVQNETDRGNEMDEENSEDEDSDNEEDVGILYFHVTELNKTVQEYIPGAVTHLGKDPLFLTHIEVILYHSK